MKTFLALLFSAVTLQVFALSPPVITSSNTTFTVGVPGSFTLAATNPPLTAGSWSDSSGNLPASLSLNPTTGKLSGTPLLSDVGVYSLSLTVANSAGTSAPKIFTLTVRPVPRIVILKEATPYTDKYYSYDHDSTNVFSDPFDNVLQPDEIEADTPYLPFTATGTVTGYYILDMVAQHYTHVGYYTDPGDGIDPPQKFYYVGTSDMPFADGFIDTMIPSRMANTLHVLFGSAYPDYGGDIYNRNEQMLSYRGLASPLAVTTGTPTIPVWTIPFAVKSLSGKGHYFSTETFAVGPPNVIGYNLYFSNETVTISLDPLLTPQANTGGLLPVIDPSTGLPVVPPQNWDGVVSNTLEYGVQLVKNALEKLKYSEQP